MENYNKGDSKIVIAKQLKTKAKGLNLYQLSLLLPHERVNVKIPGTFGRQSVTYHRYFQRTDTVSAAGDLCYEFDMNEVLDSAATTASSFVVGTGYTAAGNPVSVPGVSVVDMRTLFNLTPGTVSQARVVSASIKLTSLSTALNRTGTIYCSPLKTLPVNAQNIAGSFSTVMATIASIQGNNPIMASVPDGEGVQINYIPSDEDDFQFLPANTTEKIRHTSGDDLFRSVIICQGLQSNSQVKLEIHCNFEVIPVPAQTLSGLENYGNQPVSIASHDIEHLVKFHFADLVKVIRAYPGSSFSSESVNGEKQKIKDKDNDTLEKKINDKILDYEMLKDNIKGGSTKMDTAIKAISNALSLITGSGLLVGGGKRNLKKNSKYNKPKRNMQVVSNNGTISRK